MLFVLSSTTNYIQEERIQKKESYMLDLELEIERFNSELINLVKGLSENELFQKIITRSFVRYFNTYWSNINVIDIEW